MGASQVVEDSVDDFRLGDERDNPHRFATSGTRQRVDFHDASQQLGPASLCLTKGVGLGLDHCERLFHGVAVGLASFAPLARRVPAIVVVGMRI